MYFYSMLKHIFKSEDLFHMPHLLIYPSLSPSSHNPDQQREANGDCFHFKASIERADESIMLCYHIFFCYADIRKKTKNFLKFKLVEFLSQLATGFADWKAMSFITEFLKVSDIWLQFNPCVPGHNPFPIFYTLNI